MTIRDPLTRLGLPLMLRAAKKSPETIAVLVLEIAIAMAILCNLVTSIVDSTRNIYTESGLSSEDTIIVIQNIGVIGIDTTGGDTGSGLLALSSLPNVQSAAFGPAPFAVSPAAIYLDGTRQQQAANPFLYFGSQNLATTLGLQLIKGSQLDPRTTPDVEPALGSPLEIQIPALVTEDLARRLFPNNDALGQVLYSNVWGNYPASMRIVGVVKNFRSTLTNRETDTEAVIAEARITTQNLGGLYLIRTRTRIAASEIQSLSKTLSDAMPGFVQEPPKSVSLLRESYQTADITRSKMLIATLFVVILSTSLGIYGLTRFWVVKRTRQIGMRRTLGAQRADILIYFLTENLLICSIGAGIGTAAAVLLNSFLRAQFEMPALSAPIAFLAMALIFVICQLAALPPAIAASRIDPSLASRAL